MILTSFIELWLVAIISVELFTVVISLWTATDLVSVSGIGQFHSGKRPKSIFIVSIINKTTYKLVYNHSPFTDK